MPDPYLLISADCHAGPPQPGYRPYFETRQSRRLRRVLRGAPQQGALGGRLEGDLDAVAGTLGAFLRATGASEAAAQSFCDRAARFTAGLFDSKVRDACLDEEGIVGEVIFSDGFVENHPPFSDPMQSDGALFTGTRSWPFELRMAGAQAYNRWLADFCSESPERRAGVALLPPAHDVPALVEELQRCRDSGLRGGFLIPPLDEGLPGYHDAHYEPIWSAAVDLGMPVTVHGGNATAPDGARVFGQEEPLSSIFHFTECAFFDRRPLWFFIWGGVFERHPALRLVFAEGLAHWVPQELHRLDEMFDMWNLQVMRDRLSLRPSEYWRRNCAITATFISRAEAGMRHEIHVPNLLWGSDYPHPEGTWPYTGVCLQHAFSRGPRKRRPGASSERMRTRTLRVRRRRARAAGPAHRAAAGRRGHPPWPEARRLPRHGTTLAAA